MSLELLKTIQPDESVGLIPVRHVPNWIEKYFHYIFPTPLTFINCSYEYIFNTEKCSSPFLEALGKHLSVEQYYQLSPNVVADRVRLHSIEFWVDKNNRTNVSKAVLRFHT